MLNVEEAIKEIQKGNDSLREELIIKQKAFIYRYTSFICKKALSWENDDELSIALITFNKAIDKFETGRGVNFLGFARILIRNSLVDYFRKQSHSPSLSLETGNAVGNYSPREEEISLNHYNQELERRDRAFEIELFKKDLNSFGIAVTELPRSSPSHSDTRQHLQLAARLIAGNEDVMKRIYEDRKLPMKEIQILTGAARKSLDRWRKYLLALIIILANPDLEILSEYIKGKEVGT